jgi:hypothetical protein
VKQTPSQSSQAALSQAALSDADSSRADSSRADSSRADSSRFLRVDPVRSMHGSTSIGSIVSGLQAQTRRQLLCRSGAGLGALWCALQSNHFAAAGAPEGSGPRSTAASNGQPSVHASSTTAAGPQDARIRMARAKRVIYLHMEGSPSQFELFDWKPELARWNDQPCPGSFLEGKRFAFIRGTPSLLGPQFPFAQHGQSGAWVSDRLPNFSKVVDHVAFIRSVQTDQFNHGPAQLAVHTGQGRSGYPSLGAWVTWGLGSENSDVPGFMVLLSGGRFPRAGKSLWGSGFLPSVYQGVQCRSRGEPILHLENPRGVTRDDRRSMLDAIHDLNQQTYDRLGDDETLTRIAQYELAFRMQVAVPELMDLREESAATLAMYGAEPGGESFANNCLLARRLVERGVRFVQLYDWGWDSHGAGKDEALNEGFKTKCTLVDRAMAALLTDLHQRGLLEDTLVVWSGEFGRTPMRENRGGKDKAVSPLVGRDHHPDAFTVWMAGGGIKPGTSHGVTDEFGYRITEGAVPLRDLHATILHLLGLDHHRLAIEVQGLDQRLTGVQPAQVVSSILA